MQLSELFFSWLLPLVCMSRVRCGVRLSLSVLLSQWHLIYVHGAHIGLRHRQQQHRHTDGTTGWESVNTVHGHMCLPAPSPFSHLQYPNINQPSPSFFLFTPHIFIFFFCSLFVLPSFLSTSMNRSIFLFSFHMWSCGSCWSSSTCFGLHPRGQSCAICWVKGLSFSILWILFNLIKYKWCMHQYWFSGYQE